MSDTRSSVYFIFQLTENGEFDEGCCKIGYSGNDSLTRAKQLQTANSRKLKVYTDFFTPYPKEWESFFHKLLHYKHIRGEWYAITTLEVSRLIAQYEEKSWMKPRFVFEGIDCILKDGRHLNNNEINDFFKTKTKTIELERINKLIAFEDTKDTKCNICKKEFTSLKKYKSHIFNQLNPCNLICVGCDEQFNSKTSWLRHKKLCDLYKLVTLYITQSRTQ